MSAPNKLRESLSYDAELIEISERQIELLAAIRGLSQSATAAPDSTIAQTPAIRTERVEINPTQAIELNQLVAQIDELTQELASSVKTFKQERAISPTAMMQRAALSKLPRNDAAILQMLRDLAYAEQSEELQEAFDRRNTMTMDQILERFGRPDNIQRNKNYVYWNYFEHEDISSDRFRVLWKLDLIFQDGVLLDSGGGVYE